MKDNIHSKNPKDPSSKSPAKPPGKTADPNPAKISTWANTLPIQASLKINTPGDQYEQEADRIAGQVMGSTGPDEAVQRQEQEQIQRTAVSDVHQTAAPPSVSQTISQPGRPLDDSTRSHMESRFGQDFGHVRTHTEPQAAESAEQIQAKAYTTGSHIVFGPGQYAPHSQSGRQLLAHELAHVVQQQDGPALVARDTAPANSSLPDRAVALHEKLIAAKTAADWQPLLPEALKLAEEAGTAITAALAQKNSTGNQTADDIRNPIKRIGRELVNKKEISTARKFADKTQDVDVKQAVINTIRSHYKGVSGQQSLLIRLATFVGMTLAPQTAKETTAQWLDKNTTAIGQIYTRLDTMGLKGLKGGTIGLELSQELLAQYFVYSETARDPDPLGKLTKLTIDTQTKQIEADCDVWATYGARLLRAQGWDTVGYMALFPDEMKPDDPTTQRDAHAVALARKANPTGNFDYLGVSNANIKNLLTGGTDTAALKPLRDYVFDPYGNPLPQKYRIYYLPAKAGGAYDDRIKDPVANKLKIYEKQP